MHTTPVSLLERLHQPGEQLAWVRFARLYSPLLFHWARSVRLPSQESADLVQDVLTLLVRKLPEFTYNQHQSFRSWLRTVTFNKWRENQRRRTVPVEPVDPQILTNVAVPECESVFADTEYRRYLVHRALALMQAEFQPQTWKACYACVVDGRPAA
jgi:RNA polymerase sigma-70 factor (ECF subfamily)